MGFRCRCQVSGLRFRVGDFGFRLKKIKVAGF